MALTQEEVEQWAKSLFDAQAYLMTYAPLLLNKYNYARLTRYRHPQTYIVESNDPESIVNRLTVSPTALSFIQGDNVDFSQLIPHIAVYKVFMDRTTGDQEDVLYPFANETDFDFLKPISSVKQAPGIGNVSTGDYAGLPGMGSPSPSSLRHMGAAAGIRSVHWKMEGRGRNPYSAHIVDVTLKMFFQDVKTLFHALPIPSDKMTKIKNMLGTDHPGLTYSDLIRIPASTSTASTRGSRGLYHRIRLELGWSADPDNELLKQSTATADFAKEINNTRVNIIADRYEHNIDFKENGTVELTVQFKGSLEANTTEYDMLAAIIEDGSKIYAGQISQAANAVAAARRAAQAGAGPPTSAANSQALAMTNILQELASEFGQAATRQQLTNKGVLKERNGLLTIDLNEVALNVYTRLGVANPPTAADAIQRALQTGQYGRGHNGTAATTIQNYNSPNGMFKRLRELANLYNNAPQARQSAQQGLNNVLTAAQQQLLITRDNAQSFSIFQVFTKMLSSNLVSFVDLTSEQKLQWGTMVNGALSVDQTLRDTMTDIDLLRDTAGTSRASQAGRTARNADLIRAGRLAPGASSLSAKYFNDLQRASLQAFNVGPDGTPLPAIQGTGPATIVLPTERLVGASDLKAEVLRSRSPWNSTTSSNKLYYFFLGDLVNEIFKIKTANGGTIGEEINKSNPNFKFLFGPTSFSHPLARATDLGGANPVDLAMGRSANSAANLSYGNGLNNSSINLFFLPIHVEGFMTFLTDKVIGEGKKSYSLLAFILDLIQYVMNEVLGANSAGASPAETNKIGIDLIPAAIPTNTLDRIHRVLPPGVNRSHAHKSIRLGFDATSFSDLSIGGPENTIGDITPLWFLIGQDMNADSKSAAYKGEIQVDQRKGVWHFDVGGPNRGILKSIKFKEVKNSLFGVAVYRSSTGAGNLIRNGVIEPRKLSLQLKLVGNPFFSIGQLIYINTRLVDGGYFIKEQLGFGGYYFITSVDNYYDINRYDTEIEAIMMMMDSAVLRNADITSLNAINAWQAQSMAELNTLEDIRRSEGG